VAKVRPRPNPAAHAAALARLREQLENERRKAEAELTHRGREKDAWRLFEVCFDGSQVERPQEPGCSAFQYGWFGSGWGARMWNLAWYRGDGFRLWLKVRSWEKIQRALGPRELMIRSGRRPNKLPIDWTHLDAGQQRLQILQLGSFGRISDSWLWAERAAVAAAAIERLNDPLVTFAVGLFFAHSHAVEDEQQRWQDYADRILMDTRSDAGRAGGKARAARKPAATRERNEQMIVDYDRAVVSDLMDRREALRYAANKHGVTAAQARRIIKPRTRWPRLRAVLLAQSAS